MRSFRKWFRRMTVCVEVSDELMADAFARDELDKLMSRESRYQMAQLGLRPGKARFRRVEPLPNSCQRVSYQFRAYPTLRGGDAS